MKAYNKVIAHVEQLLRFQLRMSTETLETEAIVSQSQLLRLQSTEGL